MNKPGAGLLNRQRGSAFPSGTAETGYFFATSMPNRGKQVFGGNQMSQSSKPSLSSYIQSEIGGWLRAVHDEVVKEGIPKQFVELLRRLDGGESLSTDP